MEIRKFFKEELLKTSIESWFQGTMGGEISMCMFNDMDIDCSKECPEKIRKICDSGFLEEIENIISLAVSKGRKKH